MQTRTVRRASIFLLGLLLADTILAGCVGGGTSIRRPEEDAWLLSIAGYYQLMGEQPPTALAGSLKMARLAEAHVRPQQSTNSNEVWTLIGYYAGLRDRYEKEGRARGLSDEAIQELLAGIDAKIADLIAKAKDLDARRARHRGTIWKRFFDGLGRGVGRAFDFGGKVAKFVIEDLPETVATYAPGIIKELAQQYIEKLKETAKGRLFDFLAKKAPGVVTAYLFYELGRKGVQVAREIDRQLGRHPSGRAEQESTAMEPEEGEEFQLPTSGTMTATCAPSGAQSIQAWCPTVQGTLTANTPLTVTIDFSARTFTFGYMVACEGRKSTESSLGTWRQNLSSDEMQGSGTVYEDGWLLGEGAGMYIWIERGTWWKAGNVVPINKVKENPSTVPVAILLDTPDDLMTFELGWGPGWVPDGPAGAGFTIEQARELGWEGLLGFAPTCTTCVSLCEVISGP